MSDTVLLLDLDGVVNCGNPRAVWGDGEMTLITPRGWNVSLTINWSPTLIQKLRELPVEIRLCSTWCEQPTEILAALGLSDIPLAFTGEDFSMNPHSTDQAKFAAARHVIENEKRRLIWVDDEAIPNTIHRVIDRERVLLVEPTWEHGLSPRHLERITAWLSR